MRSAAVGVTLYKSILNSYLLDFTVTFVTQTGWNVDIVPLTGNPGLIRYEVIVEHEKTR